MVFAASLALSDTIAAEARSLATPDPNAITTPSFGQTMDDKAAFSDKFSGAISKMGGGSYRHAAHPFARGKTNLVISGDTAAAPRKHRAHDWCDTHISFVLYTRSLAATQRA